MRPRRDKMDFGLTGGMAEEEVLGEARNSESFREWAEHRDNGYLKFRDAVEAVKHAQPENADPNEPNLPFPLQLHNKITDGLEVNWDKLGFFTCVGFSEMDYRHGVDAFFELETETGRKIIVTIDLTLNPDKASPRADVIVTWPPDGLDPSLTEDQEEWFEKVEETSQQIVDVFKSKIAKKRKQKRRKRRKRRKGEAAYAA